MEVGSGSTGVEAWGSRACVGVSGRLGKGEGLLRPGTKD